MQTSPSLAGRRIIALDLAGLLAGTQYRGAFEERIQGLIQEVAASKGQVLLFIDELHLIGKYYVLMGMVVMYILLLLRHDPYLSV